ncbi:MAG: DUF4065 domain-containing protein [Chitinophagaceae bacterium]|nr:DUF4065 domain-containing protein [Chitinophagaceae bacterium]
MRSPVTGGEMEFKKGTRVLEFRKDNFTITFHYYKCKDTGEEYTTSESDTININQVYNQYREKYGIPFTEEIINIRLNYGLSAAKMSEVLGLGANVYRNYEAGEIPSVATGRLIRLASDPVEFMRLLEMSKNVLEPHEYEKVKKKTLHAISEANPEEETYKAWLFENKYPGIMNGYKTPDLQKIKRMIRFFAHHNAPFTTALNKLMFYADFGHFKKTGFSISGLCYKAIQRGPVPENYGGIYNYVVNTGFVAVEEMAFGEYVGERFVATEQTDDPAFFSDSELQMLKKVSDKFKGLSTKQIVDISHEEPAWKNNVDDHNRISFDYGFELKNID